jgi:ribosome-binding factor A
MSSRRTKSERWRGSERVSGSQGFPRTARVNELLREVLAEELERLADVDERLRMATLTGVDTSADLRHATVYLSSIAVDLGEALEEQRVHLQRVIAREVRMKRTPHLRFMADPGVALGQRVEEILRKVHAERPVRGT